MVFEALRIDGLQTNDRCLLFVCLFVCLQNAWIMAMSNTTPGGSAHSAFMNALITTVVLLILDAAAGMNGKDS